MRRINAFRSPNLTSPFEISVRAAQLNAQEVKLGEVLTLQEVRVNVGGLSITPPPNQSIHIAEATATLIATESSLNQLLKKSPPEGTRDLSLATLTGKVRIEGKALWNRIPVPFAMTAVPEIEGGARLRLNVQQVQVFGPIGLPGVITQGIANKINDTLAEKFDVTKLPLQIRLTGLTVEPGRILLSATASLEMTALAAPAEALEKRSDT